MNNFNEQLSAIETAIINERKTEQMAVASFGQALYDDNSNNNFPEESKKIVDIIQEIADLENQNEKLHTKVVSEKQLTSDIKTVNAELKKIKNDIQSNLSPLGRGAWEFWRYGGVFDEAEEILEHLIKEDARLQDVDRAASSNKQNDARFGKTLLTKGKDALLTNRRRLIISSMNRQWEPVGKQILERISLEVFKGTQAEIPANKLETLKKNEEDNKKQLQHLKNEYQLLQTELEAIPGRGSSTKKLENLEKSLEAKRNSLEDAYRQFGYAWLHSDKKEINNEEAELRNKRLEEVVNNIKTLEEKKRSVELQREYHKLQLEIEKKTLNINNIEEKINELQTKLKTRKKELKETEKKAAEIKKSLPEPPDTIVPE